MDATESAAETIFFGAMQCAEPERRARYVEDACAGDAALRRRVERLLGAQANIGGFLESPAVADLTITRAGARVDVSPVVPERLGTMIGPYKLLERIGEGGFGSVFLAEQTHPVRRTVALKIVKPGMDSRQVVARFEAERQALALMDHPNIAKVLDAGTTDSGRPYFVMELVKGVPITTFCDERRLPPRERLALFVDVCHAVQHAHQKGIIHRDLKPSNVLVALYDQRPVPKVIDFGVAKALGATLTDRTMFTGVGAIVGTLEYMPPEQAQLNQLDVDTRSDVYSLGVMLYELLTGGTPIGGPRLKRAALEEVLRLIRQEEPPKPSTRLSSSEGLASIAANRGLEPKQLNGLVRGELDWIVMKALEKDRDRRYETANGLARDVERYLHDEAVEACPPSAVYRFGKFARRHRAGLAVGSALALVVILSVAGLIVNNRMVTREKDQKDVALASALREKQRADQNLGRARKAVKDYLNIAANNPLLKEADFHDLRRSLLESAIPFYREFVAQRADDPELEAERGEAYVDLALVWEELGEVDKAMSAYDEHRAIFERLVAERARPAHRHALAIGYRNRASMHQARNGHQAAEADLNRAVAIMEQLVAEHPAAVPYRRELAGQYSNFSVLLRRLGRMDEALRLQEKSVSLRERLVAEEPTSSEGREGLAQSLLNLSNVLMGLGRLDDALEANRRAGELSRGLAEEHPRSALYREMLGACLDNQSVMLCDLGRRDEGLAALQQALAINDKLIADFPSVPSYRHGQATTLVNLAILMAEMGRHEEGLTACARAVSLLAALASESPDEPAHRHTLAVTYLHQAELHRRLKQIEQALAALRSSVAIQEKLAADSPQVPRLREDLAAAYGGLGENLAALGRYEEAAAAFERAIPIREQLIRELPEVPIQAVYLAGAWASMGDLKLEQRATEAALPWYDKALARLESVLAAEPRLAMARGYASKIYLSRSSALAALARHTEALADVERGMALDVADVRTPLRLARAKALAHLDQHAQAAADADALVAETAEPSADVLHGAAGVYATCAARVRADPALSENYAVRAVALLGRAFDKDAAAVADAVAKDTNLDVLRSREDFRKLTTRQPKQQ